MSVYHFSFWAAALIIGLVLGYAAFRPVNRISYNLRRRKDETAMQQWLGEPLPQALMVDLNGRRWESADEAGRVLVLVFWSVSCGSCQDDLEKLNAVYRELKERGDFAMIGIPLQQETDVVAFMSARTGVEWPQTFEFESDSSRSLAARLHIRRSPSIWVVDREGIIRGVQVTAAELPEVLDDILSP